MRDNHLDKDLDYILALTEPLWKDLRGQRIFITGGTGFFGCWLLESLAWANDKLGQKVSALVLTRNPEAFRQKAPHLAVQSAIRFHTGEIQSFAFPAGEFSHIIHAATEASAQLNERDPLYMIDTIVQGTRRTLEFAKQCGAEKFLLVSSGAIYGKQPPELTHVPEDYPGGPDSTDVRSAYGEGKRVAELLCTLYARHYRLETKIARCFAFVGPYLPLDIHFAIGNFIRDGMAGGPIQVKGDGTPYRSYLYAADLAIWLWTILLRGKTCRPYNVGSEEGITIADLSYTIARCFHPPPEVQIARQREANQPPERYVPAVQRALVELDLRPGISLGEALTRTVRWYATRSFPHAQLA
jgi:dTDP-glucose 4,6-dehydratase